MVQNKQTGPFTQGMCALSLCVLFALGRRFKGKKCNDVICYPETLLQVQSGDDNKLAKYTRIPEQNTYSNGIRPPFQILVAEYPFICLCFSVTLLKTHTHTQSALSHLSFSLSLVIDLRSGHHLMGLKGAQASLHTNSMSRCNSEISLMIQNY